jgi:hypothetical protein
VFIFETMNAIFKKLNFKDHGSIYVLNAPNSFKGDADEMTALTRLKTAIGSAKHIEFILAFVTKQKEVDDLAGKIASLVAAEAVVWFAYPKGGSKKYKCEFNRDNGWTELGKQGFEPVRMVAIDEDWSALRFKKAEHIKSMTRSSALSDVGKKKIAATKKQKP